MIQMLSVDTLLFLSTPVSKVFHIFAKGKKLSLTQDITITNDNEFIYLSSVCSFLFMELF